jgi:ATPase subunit of ABC transporter with duplicated ATPase domains
MSLIVRSLSYIHPDNENLFQEITFSIPAGEKSALVGINGAGKSTLLRLIAGKILPSSGEIISSEIPWYVPQHLGEFDDLTIAEALAVDKKINAFTAILSGDANPVHFTDLDDDWEIEEKVTRALDKWELGAFNPDHLMGKLSGGQKTKVFFLKSTLLNFQHMLHIKLGL